MFFALLALSSGSVFGAMYNKKFEETLPITVMSSMIFLYIFYIFNKLFLGLYILWAVMLLCYLFFIYKFIKSTKDIRKNVLKNIFTPGLLIFIIVFCAITIITRGRFVLLWDELRLWGAYPKILYYDGSLQLGNNIQLMSKMQSYEPGVPLFQFLFAKSAGYFAESNLFLAYALLGVTIFLPITKKITWKKWYLIPIYSFLVFMIPLALNNSNLDYLTYYNTLFVDPMLGVYFAYTLYLAYTSTIDKKYKLLLFTLGVCTLTLLKDTGIVFATCSCIAFIINSIINMKKNKEKISLKYIFIPIISIILVFGSWKLVQRKYELQNMYAEKMDKTEISSFFKMPSEEQKQIVNDFKDGINNSSIIISSSEKLTEYLTYKNLMVFLFISFAILVILKEKSKRKSTIIAILMYFLGSIIFTIGTLGVYLFSIHVVESFARYMSTIITTGVILLFLLIIEDLLEDNKCNERYKCYISAVIIIFIMILPIKLPDMGDKLYFKDKNELGLIYSDHINKYLKNGEEEKVALIFSGNHYSDFSYVIYHHQIYMDLIDEGIKYKNITENLISENMTYDEKTIFNDFLKDFDYAYFIVIDEIDKEILNAYLDEPMYNSTLFKVNNNNEVISLKPME